MLYAANVVVCKRTNSAASKVPCAKVLCTELVPVVEWHAEEDPGWTVKTCEYPLKFFTTNCLPAGRGTTQLKTPVPFGGRHVFPFSISICTVLYAIKDEPSTGAGGPRA